MNKNILKQYQSLIFNTHHHVSLLANTSAFIFENFNHISWAGFYLFKDNELILGPFQGKVACTNIALNKGVCGKAAVLKKTLNVKDVHQFSGHIACDAKTNSELVVPILKDNKLYGVLDLDSQLFDRFQKEDQDVFETIVSILENALK